MIKLIETEFVVYEGELVAFRNELRAIGTINEERPFIPKPEEFDRFSDAQMDPLMVIAVGIGVTALVQQVLNLVDRLRGEEVLVIDATESPVQVRRVPKGKVTEIAVVHRGGANKFSLRDKHQAMAFLKDLLK
jgi:hypothetical protein